jgi:hypothetical protein
MERAKNFAAKAHRSAKIVEVFRSQRIFLVTFFPRRGYSQRLRQEPCRGGSIMVSSNVQEIYDVHVAGLSAGERLRLVELITRGMAEPRLEEVAAIPAPFVREAPGWQAGEQRGSMAEWRDRSL